MKAIIVAQTTFLAVRLARELGIPDAHCFSPEALKCGAGRGLTASALVIEENSGVTEDDVDTLQMTLIASGGPTYTFCRGFSGGAT